MGNRIYLIVISLAFINTTAIAQLKIVPTTTLAKEIGNNTSAPNTTNWTSNGNTKAGNVSKESIRNLIAPNTTMKFFAHVMPWWGKSGHINIGYNSQDPSQVKKQVEDMISRGYDGVIIAEHNSADFQTIATQVLVDEVERHPGFYFIVQENKRALESASDKTAKLISDLKYARDHFFNSPNYYKISGRPVFAFYDGSFELDWIKAQNSLTEKPLFIFRNSSGFTHEASNGAFAWIGYSTSSDPSAISYLTNFYDKAQSLSGKYPIGSAYKGMDDSLASWGKDRYVPQRCGITWIKTFEEVKRQYGAYPDNVMVQLNTWNDYEEGTEIESGINNCAQVKVSLSGSNLSWSISGTPSGYDPETTIARYQVFISSDGQNLMKLIEKNAGDRTVNLSSFALANGTYYIHVKAVGKSTITNQMSAPVKYTVPLSSTPTTTTRSITVIRPTTSSVGSPVRVTAQAYSPERITAVQVYVDGTKKAAVSTSYLDTSISMSKGTRNLTFKAWDASGTLWKQFLTITIQ
jgi:hypothetical protein